MFDIPYVEIHTVDHCNNNCRWCHNYSPFCPEKEYEAGDYFPGLDILNGDNFNLGAISLMGGEPFLHSDITRFAFHIWERYKRPMVITSNGFWLSEDAVRAYKDLWQLMSLVKISRYPTIEKRLGGYEEAYRIAMLIKEYNPHVCIQFPQKSIFNKLETFEQPREVKRFCGNSHCMALLRDMTVHRCGAGGYQRFAPEGILSEGFRNCPHMSYDLKNFDYHDFVLWRSRFPLEACSYCNFSDRTPSVGWKVEKGHKPFNMDYELAYHYNLAKSMVIQENLEDAQSRAEFIRCNYGELPQVDVITGLIASQHGDMAGSLKAFSSALQKDSKNPDAKYFLDLIS
ncbi:MULTISPECIES: radical SAM protein [unclassified Maridesulfovibrio]|uniref:radical SAM protein n=1 Tax=unclassified Maridesulfovibrio TaxID=2794999 RepID=UPI003B4131C9